ncbi:hypothetical protein, conserved [Plasmodium gonderi]|uniref:Inner membrane complex protein 1i n=1 Tax=Plasmodium gonderi TaxID=77519 RepID=A0A1Y1JBP7_PLAGO|nr:hypothetical protein, conserved [Plasmodium gonderi]GAW79670.1 hypothetical protein, conserved [Plasmodium gonderi]
MKNNMENAHIMNVPYTFEHSKNLGNKILKPIRQEKVVKVPVTQYVEKIIEKEEIKYVNKYVDVIKPIITYKTKHISKPIYLDKIKYEPKLVEKEKIVHIPKIEYRNKIVEIPVYIHKENIIEKKVPLIIERVVPVLKVKRIEKETLIDTIEIPSICEMKKKEININNTKNEYEQNILHIQRNNSGSNNFYTVNVMNENQDIYNKETYRNMESQNNSSPAVYSHMRVSPSFEIEKIKRKNESGHYGDSIESDEDNYERNLQHKNETMYNDATHDDDIHYEQILEKGGRMVSAEGIPDKGNVSNEENILNERSTSNEENVMNEEGCISNEKNASFVERLLNEESNLKNYMQNRMENNYYNTDNRHKKSSVTHVSVHLPTTKEELRESLEPGYVNSVESSYNVSLNPISVERSGKILDSSSMGNNMDSSNMYVMNNNHVFNYNNSINRYNEYNMNELINEQLIRGGSLNNSKPDISKSIEENVNQLSYCTNLKDHMETEQHTLHTPSNMHVYKENYVSSQNERRNQSGGSKPGRNKLNFMPSYANSNGNAIVSVRPATILEYVPKERKFKSGFCNFMNKCCGGE